MLAVRKRLGEELVTDEIGSGHRDKISRQRQSTASGGYGESKQDFGSGQRGGIMSSSESCREESPRLACPFFKYDTSRKPLTRSCLGPGWPTVRRVKEHVLNYHCRPLQCEKCHQSFANNKAFDNHKRFDRRNQYCGGSPKKHPEDSPDESRYLDKFQVEELRLKTRSKAIREEEKWEELFGFIFPLWHGPPPSPHNVVSINSDLNSYMHSIRSGIPRFVANLSLWQEIEGRVGANETARMKRQLAHDMLNLLTVSPLDTAVTRREQYTPVYSESTWPANTSNASGYTGQWSAYDDINSNSYFPPTNYNSLLSLEQSMSYGSNLLLGAGEEEESGNAALV